MGAAKAPERPFEARPAGRARDRALPGPGRRRARAPPGRPNSPPQGRELSRGLSGSGDPLSAGPGPAG